MKNTNKLCQLVLLLLLSVFDQASTDESGSTHRTQSTGLDPRGESNHSLIVNPLNASSSVPPNPHPPLEESSSSINGKDNVVDPASASIDPDSTICAYFDDHPSTRMRRIELSKRFYKKDDDDNDKGEGSDDVSNEVFYGNGITLCKNYCFTLWVADPRNKSRVTVSKQGCWLIAEGQECQPDNCVSNLPPRQNNTHFCCCKGSMCNTRFVDVYNPAEHTTGTSTTTEPAPLAVGPLHDDSYRKKTIIISLVSVITVSLVIVFTYAAYRLCLTPKPTTSHTCSVPGQDNDTMPPQPAFNIDDLKMEDVIVSGRYSEVRRGMLGDTEVAVKIYQPHHRQYYHNERNSFALPFMEHENVVKFYGAKELEDPGSNLTQYIIVTAYITQGSLTSHLKHNTLDWYTLCHMCQGIVRGLAYLHTDIQKGGLYKPAIAHRDVNSRNILVTSDLTCVIADLGFSVGMIGSKIIKNGVAESAEQASLADVGTLRYMAPEVFDGAVNLRDCEASLKQIDIYALGLVMWEVASRCVDLYQGAPVPDYQLPFQAEGGTHPTFEEMQVLVVKYKTRPKFPDVWKDTNPAVRSLKETIEDCWDNDAEARLTSLCVLERVTDMTALWVQGAKHRGVTPTLNATINLPEGSTCGVISSGSAIVSNGVTYLPSYVDRNNELNEVDVEGGRQRAESEGIVGTSYNMRYNSQASSTIEYDNEVDGVTQPLISSISHLTASDSSDVNDGRIKSWHHEQSTSGSTMDTILPLSPSDDGEVNHLVAERLSEAVHGPVKASNVMLAQNKAVILHPNQGRNPTVERNTHKRSDEELTIMGNRLVGPGDQPGTLPGNQVSTNNRRGSLGAQSAPPTQTGGVDGGSYDGMDAVESSSLVQNDLLNQHVSLPRTLPIPYVQNHVHGEVGTGIPTRPKLANISGNRGSYLRLQGEDRNPNSSNTHPSMDSRPKSIRQKLNKLIRPKELGMKFSKMVFGEKGKKGQVSHVTGNVADVEGRGLEGGTTPGQYVNSGLETSPIGRNVLQQSLLTPVSMEVQVVNGSVITRALHSMNTDPHPPSSYQAGNLLVGPQPRLSTTNVMQLGNLATGIPGELPPSSLFLRSGDASGLSDSVNYLSSSLEREKAVPLENLDVSRTDRDHGSVHAATQDQVCDQDGLTETISTDLTYLTPSVVCPDGVSPEINCCSDMTLAGQSSGQTAMANGQNHTSLPLASHSSSFTSDMSSSRGTAPKLAFVQGSISTTCDTHDSDTNLTVAAQSLQNRPIPKAQGICNPSIEAQLQKQVLAGIPSAAASSKLDLYGLRAYEDYPLDTKGGNSIMLDIHAHENSLSRDAPASVLSENLTQVPVKSVLQIEMSSANAQLSGQGDGINPQKSGPAEENDSAPVARQETPRARKLCQSQSVNDLDLHRRHRLDKGGSQDGDVGTSGCRDRSRQERDMMHSFSFCSRQRPQSLSFKGHNYNRGRGGSTSSCSSSSSSSTSTSSSSLPLSAHKKAHLPPATASTTTLNSTDRGKLDPLGPHHEHGTLSVLVPNVTLDKNCPLFQIPSNLNQRLHTIAPVAVSVPCVTVNVGQSTGGNFKGNSTSSASNTSSNNSGRSNEGVGNTDIASVPSHDVHASSGRSRCEGTESTRIFPIRSNSSDSSSSKRRASGINLRKQSDSSEKIRKRIKTPISFHKGRLSLYDDRLMTNSLGCQMLSATAEDKSSMKHCLGDSNNNDGAGGSKSGGGGGMCGRQIASENFSAHRKFDGASHIRGKDYLKMIRSDSDLVV